MIKPADFLSRTTDLPTLNPLDDALDDLRISGSMLLHEAYAPGWAIDVPDEATLRGLMGVAPATRVLPFHLVRRGTVQLVAPGRTAVQLEPLDLAILFGGAAHLLSSGRCHRSVPLRDILAGAGPATAAPGTAVGAEVICGAFVMRSAPLNPLVGALPPVIVVKTGGAGVSAALSGVATLLASETGSRSRNSFTVQRLLEILCAEAVRAYLQTGSAIAAGWFRGLADPKIAEALRHIHAAPDQELNVRVLAAGVALSPSRFAARFRTAMGESVMEYVGRWRVNLACRLLRETDLPLSRVGARAGYRSVPSFSRAFSARIGTAPAAWRATRHE